MRFPNLKGKKYIGLVRCSTKEQADTSIDDQLTVLRSFADEHQMVYVDDVILDGVSGSVPGARNDIEGLVARKNEQDDFELVLVHDSTRLTRAGAQHGNKIRYDLAAAGIELVGVMDHVPDSDFADVIHTLQFAAGKQTAKAISLASARGSQSALVAGRAAYCRRPPYGIDRLYLAEDGSPQHIIRNLPNGEQVKLDPATGEIIARFGRREKTGTPVHYIKQKNEHIELVPGDPARVRIVNRIFSRKFIDNWGAYRIALELNTETIPGPTGGLWGTSAIETILRNPIYRGIGIANRVSNAIYYRRAESAPQAVKLDAKILARRKRPPLQIRPSSDWVNREQPHLKKLLDPAICKLAEAKQRTQFEHQALGLVKKPNRDRHRESNFILKNILRLPPEQGNLPLTGRISGPKGRKHRYYAVSRSTSCPTNNRVMRRMIPAEPIESAVVEMLSLCLSKIDDLRKHIRAAIDAEAKAVSTPHQIDDLKRERNSLIRKIEFLVDQLDEIGPETLKDKLDKLKTRLLYIDGQLSEAGAVKQHAVGISEDAIIDKLQNLQQHLADMPPASLRRLLEAFIARAEVDLATKTVTFELRLPPSILRNNGVCLVDTFAWKTGNQAHVQNCISLAQTTIPWCRRPHSSYWPIGIAAAA